LFHQNLHNQSDSCMKIQLTIKKETIDGTKL
jgi:hypothetical protein